jgi:hypothetical protein
MSTKGLLLFVVVALGCVDDDLKGGDTDIPPPTGHEPIECGDTDPEVYDITISNNGLYEFGEGSQTTTWPSVLVEVSAMDIDGDLTTYILDLWYDTNVDGQMHSTAVNLVHRASSNSGEDCTVEATTVSSIIAIGGNPPMDQLVEFGAMVTDENGNESDGGVPFTVAFHTPNSSGNTP